MLHFIGVGLFFLALTMLLVVIRLWVISAASEVSTAQERVWTIICFIALVFTAWSVDDNTKNFRAIRTAIKQGRAVGFGPRWWIAFSSLVSSILMYMVWIDLACIGVVAMSTGPHDMLSVRQEVGEFVGYALVLASVLLALIQIWQVFARRQMQYSLPKLGRQIDDSTAS